MIELPRIHAMSALKCQGFGYPARVLVFVGLASDWVGNAALREGIRIADYLTAWMDAQGLNQGWPDRRAE